MTWIIISILIIGVIIFLYRKSNSWQYHNDMGIKYYREGNYLQASSYFMKAAKKNPYNFEILCALGDCNLKYALKAEKMGANSLSLKKSAIDYFIKSLKINPNSYNKNQMVESINEIIKQEYEKQNPEGLLLIKETKNQIEVLPENLKIKFNF